MIVYESEKMYEGLYKEAKALVSDPIKEQKLKKLESKAKEEVR